MTICLENRVFDQLQISSAKLMADLALGLYADNQLTLQQAADLAEMAPSAFLIFAGNCGIPVHYDMDDLKHDLAVLHERGIE
jgi:predicted HTH domain antitoxin